MSVFLSVLWVLSTVSGLSVLGFVSETSSFLDCDVLALFGYL